MLILDLDDTLFETKSMSNTSFSTIVTLIEELLIPKIGDQIVNQLIEELWHRPFDDVMDKYHIDMVEQNKISARINQLDYTLNITTFPDYSYLKQLDIEKVLVTTGFPKLQYAKLDALGIRNDFKAIHIDDVTIKDRPHKKGIFQKIIANSQKFPHQIWVIGDNPSSELKAGKELGLRTIQRLKDGEVLSENAEIGITTFAELKDIILK